MASRAQDTHGGPQARGRQHAGEYSRAWPPGEIERVVARFVQEWFTELDHHAPVERLLPRLSGTGLEVVFSEHTLRDHASFADWYEEVGRAYTDQAHNVERLEVERFDPLKGLVDIVLTVYWSVTSTADGTRSTYRIDQSWRLRAKPEHTLLICKYRVNDKHLVTSTEPAGDTDASGTGDR